MNSLGCGVGEVEPVSAVRALGAALRHHRMAKGLSLRALAKEIGLSAHGTLVDYEHGRRIPPEDLLVSCEKVLDLDDGTLRRLRLDALAERAGTEAAVLLTAPDAPPSPVPVVARPVWRRWRYLMPALVVVLVAAAGAVLLALRDSETSVDGGTLRFGFEDPLDEWDVLWGEQKVQEAGITTDRAYEGSHSFQISTAGPSMDGPDGDKSYGYVGFGTTNLKKLASLHAGMRVTMHLWTSYPKDGFKFYVRDENAKPIPAPETPRDGNEVEVTLGPAGWGTVTWTIPKVREVTAIVIQPYQRDAKLRVIAVDAVSW